PGRPGGGPHRRHGTVPAAQRVGGAPWAGAGAERVGHLLRRERASPVGARAGRRRGQPPGGRRPGAPVRDVRGAGPQRAAPALRRAAAQRADPDDPLVTPMGQDFAHLHVASSFSMRYGASTPEALVERAAELGQSTLGLTDRDGAYGAVRFVQACARAEISPVLGVDLAVLEPPVTGRPPRRPQDDRVRQAGIRWTGADALDEGRSARAQPVKGGALVDDQHPRVTVLARGQAAGLGPGAGWSRLCRLITQTHLAGERGSPRTNRELLARAAAPVGEPGEQVTPVVVLLGPDSDVGR